MKSAQIAKRFLDYFERQGHLVVPSSSLVSTNPTTLFAIAGMVPFIPYLLGEQKPPCPRMASNQKCVRTLDIDEVGKTTRHGTFFQMLGNFSFGDYFKEEAIHYAYEVLFLPEEQGGFGFDPERLWVTTFTDDEDARAMWRNEGFNPEHMQVMGMEDNFWTTGGPGPGGPSSEIFFDRGPEYGPDGGPSASDTRYIEIWNLVFENFEVDKVKSKTDVHIVGELANKNIDTGSGLERLAFVLQGKNNIYETDEVWAVIDKAQQLTGHTYGDVEDDDIRLRIVADHVRSALMMMSDGVRPSNAGRGYVLRRLLRRSILAMRKLGVQDHVLPDLFAASRGVMQASYPEINETFNEVSESAYGEEDAFLRTLDKGIAIFDVAVKKAQKTEGHHAQLSGKDAFTLHDTYGFPLELTLEMAQDQGISVDEEGFKAMMAEQKSRARADALKKRNAIDLHVYDEVRHAMNAPTAFLGYVTMSAAGRILGLIQEGKGAVQTVSAPASLEVVLDQTPFYAERGGQLPDYGQIVTQNGAILEVDDVQSPVKGLIVHHCHLTEGSVVVGDEVQASIDVIRRKAIARAHTATHMIHKALREELGPQALQRGSENAPDHLRFDFQWSTAPGEKAMRAVEARVNELIRENLIVNPQEMSYEEAVQLGALHMFGEKYDDIVRVVSIGEDGWSRELCGGTHVDRVGRIGMVTILSESSVGSGVRRLDALVGEKAYEYYVKERALLSQLSDSLNVPAEELPDRISGVLAKLKDAEKRLAKLQEDVLVSQIPSLVDAARKNAEKYAVVTHNFGQMSSFEALRKAVFMLREQLGESRPVVIAAVGIVDGRAQVAVATNAASREVGLRAGDLVKQASSLLGGGGGGKPDFAQGGGTNLEAIDDALNKVQQLVQTFGTSR